MPSIHLSALRFNLCVWVCVRQARNEKRKKNTKRRAATYANGFVFYELYWSIFRGRRESVWVLARPFRHVFSIHKLLAAAVHSKWTNKCMEVKSFTFDFESNCHRHIHFRFPFFFLFDIASVVKWKVCVRLSDKTTGFSRTSCRNWLNRMCVLLPDSVDDTSVNTLCPS